MKMEKNQAEGLNPAAGSSFEKASPVMHDSSCTLPLDSDGNSLVKIEPDWSSEGLAIEGIKIKEEFIPDEQEAEESYSFISYQGADRVIKQEPTGIETSTIEVTSVTSLADQVNEKSSSQCTGTNFETNIQLTDELYPRLYPSPHQCSIAQESIVVKEEVVFTQENGPPYSTDTENCLAATISDEKAECDPLDCGDEWVTSEKVINGVPQDFNCNNFNLSPPNSAASTGSDGVLYLSSMAVKGGEKFVSPYNLVSKNNCSSTHTSTKKLDPALSTVLTASNENSAYPEASEDCEDHILETEEKSYHLSYQPGHHQRIQQNKFGVLCHERRDLKRKLGKHGRNQTEVTILVPHYNAQLISCDIPDLSGNAASQKIHPAISLVPGSNSAFLDEKVEVDSNKLEGIFADFNHQETEKISNGASNFQQICVTSKSNPADNLTASNVKLKAQKIGYQFSSSSQPQTFSFPISHKGKLFSCGTSTMSLKEVVVSGKIATALYVDNAKPISEFNSDSSSLKRKLQTDHARYQHKLALLSSTEQKSLCSYRNEVKYHSPADLTPISCNSSNHKSKMKITIKERENTKLRNFEPTPSEVAVSSQNDLIPRRNLMAELIPSNSTSMNEKSEGNHTNEEEIIVSTNAGTNFILNNLAKVLDNEAIPESDIESIQNISAQTLSVDNIQSQSCSLHYESLSETKPKKSIPSTPQKPILDNSPFSPQSISVLLSTKVHPRKSSFTKTTPSILRKVVSYHSQTTPQSCSVLPSTNYTHLGETKSTKSIPHSHSKPIYSSPSTNLINPQKSVTIGASDATAELDSSQSTVDCARSSCTSTPESDGVLLPTNTTSFSSCDTLREQTLCSPESRNSSFTSRAESNLVCKSQSDSTAVPTPDFSSPASDSSPASFVKSVPSSEIHHLSMAEHKLNSFLLSSDTMPISSHRNTLALNFHSGPATKHNNNFAPPARNSSSASRRKSALICKRDSEPTLFCLFSDNGHENRNETRTFKPKRKTRFGALRDLFARWNNSVPILSDAEANKWLTLNMLTCRRCDTTFETVESCLEHIEDHIWDKYVCKSCPRSFQCENLYKEHLKTHACSKFVCETCHATFWSLRAYTVHSKQPCVKFIQCSLCSSLFDPEEFEAHLAYMHLKK